MGCSPSTPSAPRNLEAPNAPNENEDDMLILLKRLHDGIQSRGPTAAALGAPFIRGTDASTPLDDLPDCLYTLHHRIPPSIKEASMRLIKVSALRKWTNLKVYEEVELETDCLQLPYSETDDELWKKVMAVSWRWAQEKPPTREQAFSPMSKRQFQELVELLGFAVDSGIEYVWIDWCCVPQYSKDSMLEVHRSKLFYARARTMLVLPTFNSLPDEGLLRVILAKALRVLRGRAAEGSLQCAVAASIVVAILAKNTVAGREYFGRVWTLAERMARYGHTEGLCNWLSLESWLGMVVDAMVQSTEDIAASIIYKKMLGDKAAALLDSVLAPLAAAVKIGGVQARACDGLEVKVADLCREAVGVWLSPARLLEEAPTTQWLCIYLGKEARSKIYHAWSEADRIWAIYSYFCWKPSLDQRSTAGLRTALEDLVVTAGGDRSIYLNGIYAQLRVNEAASSTCPPPEIPSSETAAAVPPVENSVEMGTTPVAEIGATKMLLNNGQLLETNMQQQLLQLQHEQLQQELQQEQLQHELQLRHLAELQMEQLQQQLQLRQLAEQLQQRQQQELQQQQNEEQLRQLAEQLQQRQQQLQEPRPPPYLQLQGNGLFIQRPHPNN